MVAPCAAASPAAASAHTPNTTRTSRNLIGHLSENGERRPARQIGIAALGDFPEKDGAEGTIPIARYARQGGHIPPPRPAASAQIQVRWTLLTASIRSSASRSAAR